MRHFLFVVPMLAILAGVGVVAFTRTLTQRSSRAVAVIAMVAAGALTLYDLTALHPYQYVYFNRVSGGLKHAAGRFETDYWGASYKEAFEWAVAHAEKAGIPSPIRVSSCDRYSNLRLEYYRARSKEAARTMVIVPSDADADLFIAVTRYNCHAIPGTRLHVVSRQGVGLAYVIQPTRIEGPR